MQSPKQWCCTLKDVGSPPRGGETAGESGPAGGEEGEEELCEGSCRRREQSRSPSDLVMRPHWAADRGSTLLNLS